MFAGRKWGRVFKSFHELNNLAIIGKHLRRIESTISKNIQFTAPMDEVRLPFGTSRLLDSSLCHVHGQAQDICQG